MCGSISVLLRVVVARCRFHVCKLRPSAGFYGLLARRIALVHLVVNLQIWTLRHGDMDVVAESQMWTPETWILHIGSQDKDAETYMRRHGSRRGFTVKDAEA